MVSPDFAILLRLFRDQCTSHCIICVADAFIDIFLEIAFRWREKTVWISQACQRHSDFYYLLKKITD